MQMRPVGYNNKQIYKLFNAFTYPYDLHYPNIQIHECTDAQKYRYAITQTHPRLDMHIQIWSPSMATEIEALRNFRPPRKLCVITTLGA